LWSHSIIFRSWTFRSQSRNYATDELGNLTGIEAPGTTQDWTFTYDAWSQLKTAVQGSTTISYATDAIGRMWQRTVSGADTVYKYRGLSEDPVRVVPPSGDVTSYAYSAGGPSAQKIGATTRLLLRDLHGDVVGLASTTGTVQGTRAFDPYGRPRTTTGETSALGFQGAPTDGSTGLVDMVTRHYLPTLGRFITADQVFGNLMLPVSLNRFAYAAGNPVTWTDPDGRCANPSFCPAPVTSSRAGARRWYDLGEQLNEPAYGESSGYTAYVTTVYIQRPEIRPPTFRPRFFNRLPNLLRDRGWTDLTHANYRCTGGRGWSDCGVQVHRSAMDDAHLTLDFIGMAPVVGEGADGLNAILYGIQGDAANAILYAGAMAVPTSGGVLRAGRELVEEGVQAATRQAPDFIASADGVVVATSRSRLEGGFQAAGFPAVPTRGAGTQYTLPDGGLVRIMEPSGRAPMRASFTDAKGSPVSPFTGKPVQPPAGLTPGERRAWIIDRTHVELGP